MDRQGEGVHLSPKTQKAARFPERLYFWHQCQESNLARGIWSSANALRSLVNGGGTDYCEIIMGKKIYDWAVIAIDYDAGLSWDNIKAKFGCGHEAIQKAIKTGKLRLRARINPKPRPRKVKTKEQNSAYCRAHYQKNKSRYKQKAKANSKLRVAQCREIVLKRFASGCIDCSEIDPMVLEFDHRDRSQKEYAISRLISGRTAGLALLLLELDKCDVRCANCHRRKTAMENNSWRTKLALGTGVDPVTPGPQPSGLPLT